MSVRGPDLRIPDPIETPRLTLVPASAELLAADLAQPAQLGRLLGVHVPDGWPPELVRDVMPAFHELLVRRPELTGWLMWYYVLRASGRRHSPDGPILIGDGGFGGWPESGTVVMGYSVMASFHGQGFATEAAAGMVRWAFEHEQVRRVVADVFPDNLASVRVLQKVGLTLIGDGSEPGAVRYSLDRKSVGGLP